MSEKQLDTGIGRKGEPQEDSRAFSGLSFRRKALGQLDSRPYLPYDIACDMRLALDTDVVLSGLRSTVGASRVLLLAVEAKAVTPLVSVAAVLEYETVLKRADNLKATQLEADEVDRFLDALVAHAEPVAPHFRTRPLVRDPDDELFAELALNGHADALVSFNIADYRPTDHQAPALGILVCRPGEILRRLAWQPSATSRSGFLPR